MRRIKMFASKGTGVALVALLLAAMGNVASYANSSSTVAQKIEIPGEVPAFNVGFDDGDPATADPYAKGEGVKNLALTLEASRETDLLTSATIGGVTNCAADAKVNTLLEVSFGGTSAASIALYVEYDKTSWDGLSDSHVWLNGEGEESLEKTTFAAAQTATPQASRTVRIPICIR